MEEIVYKCNACGNGFSLEEGDHYEIDGERWTRCPSCWSDDIEEAVRCPVCRGIYWEHEMDGKVCKGCMSDAVDAYKSCLRSLMGWERDCLEDKYGEIDITERD